MFGTARLQMLAVGVVVLVLTHLAAYIGGYWSGVSSERGQWMLERARIVAQAEAKADALRADGRRLAAELETARAQVRVEYVEKVRVVVRTASKAKSCLSPDTTAALNRQPIRETVERPGSPPAEIIHPAGTSELAAAEWIAHAQAEHAQCRQQVARLVDWIRNASGGRQ
jgi:hypothetical protein